MTSDLFNDLEDLVAEEQESEPVLVDEPMLKTLASELETLRESKQDIDEELKRINARLKELEETLIPEEMRRLGLIGADNKGSFTTANGGSVYLRTDVYASVNKAKEDELFTWLRDTGNDALIKETVNAQTLRAFVREQREMGRAVPFDLVNQYEVTKAVLKRGK